MSQTVFGAQAVVSMLNRAFNNTSPANAVFNNQVAAAGSTEASQTAFALQFGNSFAGLTDAQLSTRVLGNLGVLPNAELEAAVTQYFADNGLANRGLVVLQLGQILSTLETAPAPQNIFNDAAKAWNIEVEKSFVYSSTATNTTAFVGDFPVTPVGQGQTFTLTAGVDTIPGVIGTLGNTNNAGDDTIIAGEGSAGGMHTLGASDVINGGTGTDMIDIKSIDRALTPRISSVEKVFVQALGTGFDSVNMVNASGVTELWSNNSTANLSVTNLQEKATIGVKGGVAASNYTVAAATVAARTGDLAIALDKAKVGNLFVNATGLANASGYTSTTINAVAGTTTADRNTVNTLDVGNALATVKVIGDGALTVTADLAATVRTIDASANKGGANLSITNNTGNTTFTGGEGADRINFGGTLNLNDKVDGGAGRDALAVTSQASIIAGLQVSNTEILELNTLNGTVNAALIAGVDEVQVTTSLDDTVGGGVAIVNGLTSNSTFVTNDSGDVRLNITNAQVAGTADTLNLKSGIAGVGSVRVMAAGVETVAYTQTNLANAGANTTLSFYDTDGFIDVETLTLTNTAGNSINANGLVNSIKTVDASTAQGNVFLSVAGGNPTNGVTLKGGAGADGIMGGDGKDVINAGAGNDAVISGDLFARIVGTGGAAIPQVSTITIANAEVGDVFTINGNAVTWTGVEATDNAAVIAAAATAGVTVAADTAAVNTSGTFTMTGAATGAAFALPTVAATNVAAKPEVSTVTINNASTYDAGDVVSVTIAGTTFSHTATAGQTANQIAAALVAQINGTVSGNSMTAAAPANVITLTGANATTNYAITAATTNVNGGAQVQTAQVTTLTLGGTADVADNFSVNVNGTVYQGASTAALAAAIGTAGGTIQSAVATSATVVTLTGLANGTAFTAAAGPTTNQPAVAGTATINFASVASWDQGDAYAVTINGTAVNTGPLGADGNATATGTAFVNAFYLTTLPAAGFSAVNNAGVVTVTGPAAGTDVLLTAETNTQKAAVAQVQSITFTDSNWTTNGTTGAISVTVNGQAFVETVSTASEAGGEAAVTAIVNQINLSNLGVTATAVNGANNNSIAGLTLTANVAGTPFTASGAQAGAAGTPPAVGGSVTTANDTVTSNIVSAVDNNDHRAAGTNDQTLTVVTTTPAVATTTVANANPVVVDNTFTPAGANTQTIAAATGTVGQASATQYIGGAATSDTLTGGDGNDGFWFISGSNGLVGTTFTTMDTITDLNLGGATGVLAVDRVVLSNSVFNAFAATDLINAGTPLSMTGATLAVGVQALFNAGGALNGSVNDVGLFTYGSDTYLIATDNVLGFNGNDVIIKVTGVTGTLDLSDIVVL